MFSGMLFTNSYEYHQFRTARNLRTAPIFQLLKNKGAVFGEIMSYERPLWYTKQSKYVFYHGFFRGLIAVIKNLHFFFSR